MTTATYHPAQYDYFVGIDVDKKSFSFTIKDHKTMSISKKIPADPEMLYNFLKKQCEGHSVLCAYEAGPTGFHLHDYLKDRSVPCFVISPLAIPKASNDIVKNNRIDSDKLTKHIRSGEARPIRVPDDTVRELRHLVKLRENYARARRVAKQRIKALLLFTHIEVNDPDSPWSKTYIGKLKAITASPAIQQQLAMLLSDLNYARTQTVTVLRSLRLFCKEHTDIAQNIHYLRTISGIGSITAVTFLARSGDPSLLRHQREIGAFAGLAPREHSTGDVVNRGHISHLGDKVLRFLLIESAWVAIRHDPQLRQFYYRIKAKHPHKIGAKIAITAVARKLTHIMYRVLKDQRPYIKNYNSAVHGTGTYSSEKPR